MEAAGHLPGGGGRIPGLCRLIRRRDSSRPAPGRSLWLSRRAPPSASRPRQRGRSGHAGPRQGKSRFRQSARDVGSISASQRPGKRGPCGGRKSRHVGAQGSRRVAVGVAVDRDQWRLRQSPRLRAASHRRRTGQATRVHHPVAAPAAHRSQEGDRHAGKRSRKNRPKIRGSPLGVGARPG